MMLLIYKPYKYINQPVLDILNVIFKAKLLLMSPTLQVNSKTKINNQRKLFKSHLSFTINMNESKCNMYQHGTNST